MITGTRACRIVLVSFFDEAVLADRRSYAFCLAALEGHAREPSCSISDSLTCQSGEPSKGSF
jgi:hypothetical protein